MNGRICMSAARIVIILAIAAATLCTASLVSEASPVHQTHHHQQHHVLAHQHTQRPVDIYGLLFDALRSRCTREGGRDLWRGVHGDDDDDDAEIGLGLRGGYGGGEEEEEDDEDQAAKREKVLDHVFVSGLPPYASEEWVSVLLGRNTVAIDEATGARKVYVYRDGRGACSGSAVVGMVSEQEATRAETECTGRVLPGAGTILNVRVVGKKKEKDPALPEGWQKFIDAKSGAAYYYDTQTGKTQWMIPEEQDGGKGEIVDDRTTRARDGRKIAGGGWYGAGGELKEKAGPVIPGQEEEEDSSEERRREEEEIKRKKKALPRGCKDDILLVDRRAHEAAAVVAPEYGDPGFVHCIGPCQCRCRGACVGLCTCKKCECYPGTPWPMHPEIFRLRQLGIPRTLEHYNSLKPPPGYVAGVGRGAQGFTTMQDFGQSMDDWKQGMREHGALQGRGRGRGRGRGGRGGGTLGRGLGGVWGPSAFEEWEGDRDVQEARREALGQYDDASEGLAGLEEDGLLAHDDL